MIKLTLNEAKDIYNELTRVKRAREIKLAAYIFRKGNNANEVSIVSCKADIERIENLCNSLSVQIDKEEKLQIKKGTVVEYQGKQAKAMNYPYLEVKTNTRHVEILIDGEKEDITVKVDDIKLLRK